MDAFGAAPSVRLFMHDPGALPEHVPLDELQPEWPATAERALLLARSGDVVCVRRPVESDYLDYLHELGMGPDAADIVVVRGEKQRPMSHLVLECDASLRRLADRLRGDASPAVLHPFLPVPVDDRLARWLRRHLSRPIRMGAGHPAIVRFADQKHRMRAVAIGLGVPVAPGEVVRVGSAAPTDTELERTLRRRAAATGRALVRGARGASGSANLTVEGDRASLADAVRRLREAPNRVLLVEEFLELTASPNVQFVVPGESRRVGLLGVTDQRWSRPLAHAGNACPTSATLAPEMVTAGRRLATWLQERGYRGVIGFDFGEYRDAATGRATFILAEVNPRPNGATYPLAIVQRIRPRGRTDGDAAFASTSISTDARSFGQLRRVLGSRLFRRGDRRGIVPIKTSGLRQGRCVLVAIAPTRDEARAVLEPLAAPADRGLQPAGAP